MARSDLAKTCCPVSRAIERVGDPWVLVILREAFLGTRRFDDFQRHTGASPHVLSLRLKQLCGDGILRKRAYSETPPRFEYLLTDKGMDLWPLIMALQSWGEKWLGGQGVTLTHKSCGTVITPQLGCPDCGAPLTARDLQAEISPEFSEERKHREGGRP
ncbi:winged helix-turn-helix transcriptional regulator [Pseudodonghicola flavimaris]|uniref:Helix-turn-helix domain-containing protein n=1 Tax=Pseudodonghicola flavimaris TaxID=3050036 RepID=A0ABT7F102_9RHOB|nr:helix-turn-helix domain-containing protein [Pseudodonghicola flavimaris]MDK3018267.1 helix-turn-helix domain-containing protein [Pseudodonghicola flavimaris]